MHRDSTPKAFRLENLEAYSYSGDDLCRDCRGAVNLFSAPPCSCGVDSSTDHDGKDPENMFANKESSVIVGCRVCGERLIEDVGNEYSDDMADLLCYSCQVVMENDMTGG